MPAALASLKASYPGMDWENVAKIMMSRVSQHGIRRDAGPSGPADRAFDAVDLVPSDELWAVKRQLRQRLVDEARRRMRDAWLERGAAPSQLAWINRALDPDVLTIGFARRVPSYKRLTLMLRDPARLKRLLLHPERPVQLVIAGKSHPADDGG